MFIRLSIRLFTASVLSVLLLFLLAGCQNQQAEENNEKTTAMLQVSTTEKKPSSAQPSASDKGSSDKKNYDDIKIDSYIHFSDSNTVINGKGVAFENNTLYITESGTYSLEGTLTDGRIYVNSPDESKKVKLYFNGVSISCSTDAPLFIENSPDETVIILAKDSVNTLSDTERPIPEDENADYATAVIYSKDDLQLEGEGTLNINASFNKGIFSKNDIDIRGGIININSVDDGIRGKESVEISDGVINITGGGDGIRTSEETEEDKGDITISGGSITVSSALDCIQSVGDLSISGGSFNLVSAGGATGTTSSGKDDFMQGGPGGGGRPDKGGFGKGPGGFAPGRPSDSSAAESEAEDTPSTKGIKAGGKISVTGGVFDISSTDDTVHGINLDIHGGSFTLRSDDDGLHADEELNIKNSDINITASYEGVEATVINIEGGNIMVVSSDDGFNAAGESTDSRNPMAADYSCEINISDGYVFINANGDGIDSNGNVNQKGGTVIVFGPAGNMNGALDYGGKYTISGGTVLATGSAGMAQSVSGDGIDVLAFTYSCAADVLNTITDSEGNSLIGFLSPKQFGTVVFASEELKKGESYSVYTDGKYSDEPYDGIWLEGDYTKGELIGTLTLS